MTVPDDYPKFFRMIEDNYGPDGRLIKDLNWINIKKETEMEIPESIRRYSAEDLIKFFEVIQSYKRLLCVVELLLNKSYKEWVHKSERVVLIRKDDVFSIQIFKNGKLSTVSTTPWMDEFVPDAEHVVGSFTISDGESYDFYNEYLTSYVHLVENFAIYDSGESLLEFAKEITDVLIDEFKLDTRRLPYFNYAVIYRMIENWKNAEIDEDGHLSCIEPPLGLVTEERYGKNGTKVDRLMYN